MSALTLWTRRDPFAAFNAFDALEKQAWGAVGIQRGFQPAAEIVRDGDDAIVRLELPGVDPEKDVTVEVDRSRLVVRGERRDERAEEKAGRSLREVRYGSFRRTFGLPAHVTSEAISASYDAGVLSVRVTGAHANNEAKKISITV